MSTHTQGNWYYFKYPDNKTYTVAATGSIASKIRSEDDARLIACAPELLALAKILSLMTANAVDPKEFASIGNRARKLIAKAEELK